MHHAGNISATITADMFSGRANPWWDLSEEDARELYQRICELPEIHSEERRQGGLGYRGLIVLMNANKKRMNCMIYDGVVDCDGILRADQDRVTEAFAAETGRTILDPIVFDQLLLEIRE